MPKISVIVPIYNSEKFLKRCVESILAQTFNDIEVILVNDGSTDNSPSICEDYAKKDKRIVVINKPNGGLSSARNAGLDIAAGEYIGYVDSDDYIAPEMYGKLLAACESESADVAECGLYVVNENDDVILQSYFTKKLLSGSYDCCVDWLTSSNQYATAWNKIYKSNKFGKLRFK